MVAWTAARRLAALNADREIADAQALKATVFEPAEHLFVSMLGLIFRGIPVESIEQRASLDSRSD